MIYIQRLEEFESKVKEEMLITACEQALRHQEYAPDDYELSVSISNNENIQQLNRDYREVDNPTDVLSFESDMVDPDTGREYLGDIIISYEKAAEQAALADHPIEVELQLLTVHGVLHLLGYDHADEETREEMWQIQADILASLNVYPKKLPE
ncbi:MAG: rRNA maturation RNase YbeY [Anaerolineaceae bacterium]|nr:rRNA maturation RNase YbeY [Anaerolineaceae bacterium]